MPLNPAAIIRISAVIAAMLSLVACSKITEVTISNAKASEELEIVSASVDDLIKTPAKFVGRRVRVTGYWIQQFEYSALHQEPKLTNASPIWVERWSLPGGREVKNPQAITAAVEAAYKGVGSDQTRERDILQVTVEGYFDHKTSIEVTKERYPFQSGYGHLGQYQSQLTVERVVEAKLISEEPFPL